MVTMPPTRVVVVAMLVSAAAAAHFLHNQRPLWHAAGSPLPHVDYMVQAPGFAKRPVEAPAQGPPRQLPRPQRLPDVPLPATDPPTAKGSKARQPVGWPDCKARAQKRLEAMAAADAAGGWRQKGIARTRWKRWTGSAIGGAGSGGAGRQLPSALVAVPTANVWSKTELLLHSLAGNSDSFELLMVDERSSDETPERLRQLGIRMLQPPERQGVTHNWNMAYREWLNSSQEALFIINNDVLVPDGVFDALSAALTPAGGDCDLVCPLSTVAGLGSWGRFEGIEVLFGLSLPARQFVQNPLNFRRVQEALEAGGCAGPAAAPEWSAVQKKLPGFSGFFFGVRRSISAWAFDDENLFDPGNRIIGQEGDLFSRSQNDIGHRAKICLHTGAFVYHYKSSTIDQRVDRTKWHMPGTPPAP